MINETIKYEIAVHVIFLKYMWNDKGRKLCQMMKCLIFFYQNKSHQFESIHSKFI